jgi:HYR domain-containing protein
MRKSILWSFSVGLAVLSISLNLFTRTGASVAEKPAPTFARLGDSVTVRASDLGVPQINLKDGRDALAAYVAPSELQQALEQDQTQPLALCSADFDKDGFPDLAISYAGPQGGIITLHRGNVDSLYPHSPEAQRRKAEGASSDSPFLSPARAFEFPHSPDFLGAGDFDADGNKDVIAAARGGNAFFLLPGDGRGGFGSPVRVELPGTLTAMTTGEAGRADGLCDIVLGVATADGPRLMTFRGPQGAFRAKPEVYSLPAHATAIALGQLDGNAAMDVAVAADSELVIVSGRGLDSVASLHFPAQIKSLAAGRFMSSQKTALAVLTEDGKVRVVADDVKQKNKKKKGLRIRSTLQSAWPQAQKIITAHLSSFPTDDLAVIDAARSQLHIVANIAGLQVDAARVRTISLEVADGAVSALPMRLNTDALSDLVVIRNRHTAPSVVVTAPVTVFQVTSNADNGMGTLRTAIIAADMTMGADMITFAIGTGPQSIALMSPLPTVTDVVSIDGTTQPGFSGSPLIEINGTGAGAGANGLVLTAGETDVSGLVINRFNGNGIALQISGGNQITGNFIGTDPTGMNGLGNAQNGVLITSGSSNNTIGGTGTNARNIISGNAMNGVSIADSAANFNNVENNFIGTNVGGMAAIPNGVGVGIALGASSNRIGGTDVGAGNLISGNLGNGVSIMGQLSASNVIEGNFIGTNISGTGPIGNVMNGVDITVGASNNTIGGALSSTAGNTIAFNGAQGVRVDDGTGNSIIQNSIHSNTGLGIDLSPAGVTPNDMDDPDTGPNNLQNFPVLTSVVSGGGTTITGSLNSTPLMNFRIEFFSNTTCDGTNGEGQMFIGLVDVITDSNGDAPINANFPMPLAPGSSVTATATNTSGDTSEFSNCVTVIAVCTLACPANVTASNDPNQCGAALTYPPPTPTGSCGTITCSPNSGSFFPVGTTTVTCTSTTGATCSFTVTVNDTQPPTITCPPNQTRSNDPNQCGAAVTYPPPTVSDNCPNVGAPMCSPASGSFFPVGLTTVTCTVMDASSNTATCTFVVTVNDTQPPAITCPGNVAAGAAPGDPSAVVTYPPPTASDNCSGVTSMCAPPSGSSFPVGTTTVTCTATDGSANTSTCTFTVTVTSGCTITCPGDVAAANDPNQCGAVVNYPAPTPTGSCGTLSCTPPSGSFFPTGSTVVNCKSDVGPACSFRVTINDTQPPAITCPGNIVTNAAAGQSSAVVDYAIPSPTDNCPNPTVICLPPSGSVFPLGTTQVNCTARDNSANTTTCSFTVTVNDGQAPTITCPAGVSVTAQTGQSSVAVNYPAPAISDNLPGTTVACLPASGSSFPLGATPVTCTATDASGNRSSCGFLVTVNGGPPQILVTLPGGGPVIEFGDQTPFDPRRKPQKPKNNPCTFFTIETTGFSPVVLTLDSILRTGADVASGRITDPNDSGTFSLSVVNPGGSQTEVEPGDSITLAVGERKTFCLRFTPLLPAVVQSTTALPATAVVPDLINSRVNFRLPNGSLVIINLVGNVSTEPVFINPDNPRKQPVVRFTRSGNEFVVTYSVFDSNLDVSRATYEFLDSSGQVVGQAIEVDLAGPLRALNLLRGQSFTVEQRFTGASSHPEVERVRLTVFDGQSSISVTVGLSGSAAAASSLSLLRAPFVARPPRAALKK